MPAEATEKQVLKDFGALIRRHRGQGPDTLARMVRKAFVDTFNTQATRPAKTALALTRGLEARQRLMETEGGSLSSEETARLLGISKTAVLNRLAAGKLLAWREERLKAARFPGWQFDEHGTVIEGLPEVLACLGSNPHLDVWARILFFLQARIAPGGRRPLDLLREGRLKEVCRAAEAYAE